MVRKAYICEGEGETEGVGEGEAEAGQERWHG